MIFLTLISCVPFIDKYVSNLISKIKCTITLSKFFSKYICNINAIIGICHILIFRDIKTLFARFLIEYLLINNLLKRIIDRPRPIHSNGKYIPIYELKIENNTNDSFPSGHVTSSYFLYIMFRESGHINISKLLLIFTIITAYCRINIKMHHLSDCTFAVLICKFGMLIFEYLKIN